MADPAVLSDLADLELAASHLAASAGAILGALVAGKAALKLADNIVGGFILRAKGFRVHMTVKLDGELATITKIGMLSTHFEVHNGKTNIEYSAVSNTRLDWLNIRRLARRHDDKET